MAEESGGGDLPRGIALAWGVAEQPVRGPKRELSIERIVDVAVEIARSDGLAAVSMNSVASRLGYTTMSLYRYVSAKDDLLVLMSEAGIGLPPDHEPPASDRDTDDGSAVQGPAWRPGLRRWVEALTGAYAANPWLLDIPITGIPATPVSLAWMDWGLRILGDTALTHDESIAIVLMLSGACRWEATIARVPDDSAASAEQAVLRELVSADRLPALAAAIAAGSLDPANPFDPFAFGIHRLLDGIEAYLAAVADDPARVRTADVPIQADDYLRDGRLKEATRLRREAEAKLRDAQRREAELIAKAVSAQRKS